MLSGRRVCRSRAPSSPRVPTQALRVTVENPRGSTSGPDLIATPFSIVPKPCALLSTFILIESLLCQVLYGGNTVLEEANIIAAHTEFTSSALYIK